jgi:lysyl oxidase/WD40 repeat protein
VTQFFAIAFALAGIHVGSARVVPDATAPAWSPHAERIAYVSGGGVWVADANGTHRARLVPRGTDPAWSPNGRRLAFTSGGAVWTVRADGLDTRAVGRGAHPAWTPDGRRIAFDRGGSVYEARWTGGGERRLRAGTEPAFGPDGRLAVVAADGTILVGNTIHGTGRDPAWSPDGSQLAYERGGTIYVDELPVTRGREPAWRPHVGPRELLPDFDQRAPTGLAIAGGRGHWELGFTSLVDNVGLGPAIVEGVRPSGAARMVATQRVQVADGSVHVYRNVGHLRYTNSPPHHHWHLMRFDSFELRDQAGRVLVRDRKQGFCLADHYGIAPGHYPNRRPVFLGSCEQFHPRAAHVLQGTSLGYTDRYPGFFHGQNVDITAVPTGTYVLVHRVNANLLLEELRYDNDAASVRIRLTWRGGVPSVRVLRSCPDTATCGPAPAV